MNGVFLDRKVLREEKLKDQASVEAFCWLMKGSGPDKEDSLPAGIDTKFMWGKPRLPGCARWPNLQEDRTPGGQFHKGHSACVSVEMQTTLHLDPDNVILVIPRGRGCLQSI